MKFGKVFVAQMVPEWQEAYMNYGNLKKILKEIQRMKERKRQAAGPVGLERAALYRAFSGLIQRQNHPTSASKEAADIESQIILVNSVSEDGSEDIETTFLKLAEEGGEWEQEFFRRLDDEFNKVGKFYRFKVQEVMFEAQTLSKQMDPLIAFRIKANKLQGLLDPSPPDLGASNRIRPIDVRQSDNETSDKHRNFISQKNQECKYRGFKPAPVEILDHVKLNKTLDTPSDIIKGCISDPDQSEVIINRENLKKVEGQLKQAFVEFYSKIRRLKGYSFMNVLAFSKIMKKYDKITSRRASVSYMKMVDKSYLGSSDDLAMGNPPGSSTTQYKIIQHKHDMNTNIVIRRVTKLMERVEAAFIKHFSNSNRSKGMQMLRPKAKRERHRISFSLGLSVGCSFALIVALIFLVHACDLLDEEGKTQYMENMFPLYSFFAFVVLHMLMYAANIYFWRRYRVNYPFIFGFKQGTELGHREVLLVSFGLAVLALSSVLLNLDLEIDPETNDYKSLTELLPLALLLLVIVILVFPFNIIYRSSRFFFLTCMFHCICAPLYKVTFQDFFLAEQLTSEVQALRSLEFYICHYGWGEYKIRQNSCKTSDVYSTFYFIVAVIPYLSRFLQCLRRLYEERDPMLVYDGLKYFLTMAAISTGTACGLYMGKKWKIVFAIFAAIATIYGTYWDLFIDWGLLQRQSKNRWLRDKLLLPSKTVYFAAMVLNILLRFAWLQTVLDLQFPFLHKESIIAIVAGLEIIRRGIWNFFRLENEHLNNVGKYRAFKSLPLPFTYDEDE